MRLLSPEEMVYDSGASLNADLRSLLAKLHHEERGQEELYVNCGRRVPRTRKIGSKLDAMVVVFLP
jgi:hypothetical protein